MCRSPRSLGCSACGSAARMAGVEAVEKPVDNLGAVNIEAGHEEAFLATVARGRNLHGDWVAPPSTPKALRAQLKKSNGVANVSFVAVGERSELIGCININKIVRGCFHSAYLGFYAFEPHN